MSFAVHSFLPVGLGSNTAAAARGGGRGAPRGLGTWEDAGNSWKQLKGRRLVLS